MAFGQKQGGLDIRGRREHPAQTYLRGVQLSPYFISSVIVLSMDNPSTASGARVGQYWMPENHLCGGVSLDAPTMFQVYE